MRLQTNALTKIGAVAVLVTTMLQTTAAAHEAGVQQIVVPSKERGAEIAKAIPGAGYEVIEDASHFSMFGLCNPGAADIAAEEEIEDPICSDGSGRSRGAIHAQLIDMVTAAFDRALKSGH